jgi:uncharacterized protein YjbI with pentapeptide repeats
MERLYLEDKTFEQINFSATEIVVGEYDNCNFINCDFSNTSLANISFSECEFRDCNISMAALTKTAFRDCRMMGCKLLGLHFEHCSEFGLTIQFDNCLLNLSSFYKRKLKQTKFKHCSLQEVDFTEADLSGSVFDNCDFAGATFENTNLEKADFRTAYNYAINPETNRVKKAKFSIQGIAGLLTKYDIIVE